MKQLYVFSLFVYTVIFSACAHSDKNSPLREEQSKVPQTHLDSSEYTLREFPDFKLVNEEYKIIQSKSLHQNTDGLLYVFFFHPDCEDCNAEAKNISENYSKFKDAQLLWISIDGHWDKINSFRSNYFSNEKNIIFLAIADLEWQKYFGELTETPTIFVFKNNIFIKKFVLQASIEALTKF